MGPGMEQYKSIMEVFKKDHMKQSSKLNSTNM
jgi:hypothetical protein